MKPQYNHNLLTSFMLWIDYRLSNDQQAFINYGSLLYQQDDPSTPFNAWASPKKSWIYDSCVSGAQVVSGAWTSSGQFLTRDSGIMIDYTNSRILSSADWGATLSGDYSIRDFNLYLSSEQTTLFEIEKVFDGNININYSPTGAVPYIYYAPFVIFTNSRDTNEAFALGGIDDTRNIIRAYIISNDNYLQEGVDSYFRDLSRRYIPLASYGDMPLNYINDLKNLQYCYQTDIFDKFGCSGAPYIVDTNTYKMSERNNRNLKWMVSVVDFEVSKIRFPFDV